MDNVSRKLSLGPIYKKLAFNSSIIRLSCARLYTMVILDELRDAQLDELTLIAQVRPRWIMRL